MTAVKILHVPKIKIKLFQEILNSLTKIRECSLWICIHVLVKNSKLLLYHIQVVLKEGTDYSWISKIMVSYFNLTDKENPTLLRVFCNYFLVIQPVSTEFTYPLFHSCFTRVYSEKKTHRWIIWWSLAVPLEEYPFPKISIERCLRSHFYLVSEVFDTSMLGSGKELYCYLLLFKKILWQSNKSQTCTL